MKGKMYGVSIFVALLLSVCLVVFVKGESKPIVRIDPKDNTAEPDQSFTLNVVVSGIVQSASLYGWSAWLEFDQNIVNGVSASEGAFLSTSGHTAMWLTPQINNTNGRLEIGALLTPTETGFPPNGANGDGVLATVVFKAVGRGTTSLHFDFTELYTVVGNEVQIEHTAEDGSFSNGGGISSIPIQLVLVVVVVVVVVGAGALFYFKKKRA